MNIVLSAILAIAIVSHGDIQANPFDVIVESAVAKCAVAVSAARDMLRREAEVSDVFNVSCTAYTTERTDDKITATGTVAKVGTVAVDPRIIPYGTKLYIEATDGSWVYGYAIAEDCGSGIKGNKIDLFFDTYDECIQFGVRNAVVYIIE